MPEEGEDFEHEDEEFKLLAQAWTVVDGVYYPKWWQQDQVEVLKAQWSARDGDVFCTSMLPVLGVKRLLVALVEGHTNPWMPGIMDKPHYPALAASQLGAECFMSEAAALPGRRFFMTMNCLRSIPCRYPFEEATAEGSPPKVVVLGTDPRHAFVMQWEFIKEKVAGISSQYSLADFIRFANCGRNLIFGDIYEHALAWVRESEKHSGLVGIFDGRRLGSFDPKEVRTELENIAEFLNIPKERAAELVSASFRDDPDKGALAREPAKLEWVAGGQLQRQSAQSLTHFEESLNTLPIWVREQWRSMLKSWELSEHPLLRELALASLRGVASTLPLNLTVSFKGGTAHALGTCRPCVFALRGMCQNSEEMCRYCHAPGHEKVSRPRQKTRQSRKAEQERRHMARTPSPPRSSDVMDAFSYTLLAPHNLDATFVLEENIGASAPDCPPPWPALPRM